MNFDQKIQLWLLIGTWVAGLATLLAVITSLCLARRAERVRLKIWVGIRILVPGTGAPGDEHVCFNVTNIGERPVAINLISWVIGRRKKRKYGIQTLSGPLTKQYPETIAHGQDAMFTVSLSETPNWARHLLDTLDDPSGGSLGTLRAQIHTSVGQTFDVEPESALLDRLRLAARREVEAVTN